MVVISAVEVGSLAEKHGIVSGDTLLSINGNEIKDVLDYRFYCTERKIIIEILRDGKKKKVKIKKDEYDDIGLEFNTYLMDEQRACMNKCIFCFIDQLPKGMRESLYFKDDDSRLSFLFGNYITLTNIGDDEIDRIIKMHISPVNISVHTVDPKLRCDVMNNRFAGEKLKYIDRLAEAGIKINCQLVLCRGVNDGEKLRESLEKLQSLYPAVESIAAVPAGLTKYRDGLYPLVSYDKETAAEVIDIIEEYGDRHYEKTGDRLMYPSDEFFNLAGRKMPNAEYYGEMLQLENGVGMSALLKDQFEDALSDWDTPPKGTRKTIATGVGAYNLIKSLVDLCREKWHNINCEVVAVENRFFGEKITTTGLLTGQDIFNQLSARENLGRVLISRCCLKRDEDIFLDDETLEGLSQKLGTEVVATDNDGYALLEALMD